MQQGVCRRKTERRQSHQPFHYYSLIGRRRHARRQQENRPTAIDHHPPVYLAVTFAILALCFADTFNTLQLLQVGAKELNPLMDALIRSDIQLFVIAKFALTGLGLLILVGYRNHIFIKFLKTQHILYSIFALYAALILYQSVLIPEHVLGLVFPI